MILVRGMFLPRTRSVDHLLDDVFQWAMPDDFILNFKCNGKEARVAVFARGEKAEEAKQVGLSVLIVQGYV